MDLYHIIFYFFIYSFLGWCSEVIYSTIKRGKFINRGFLNGPVCPIYGTGFVVVLLILSPIKNLVEITSPFTLFLNTLVLFLSSAVLTTLIELITGWVLERFFKLKWWDYSDQRFNFRGYICLKFAGIWGIFCVIMVNFIHPLINELVDFIPLKIGNIFLIVHIIIILVDLFFTVVQIASHNRIIKNIDEIENKLKIASNLIGNEISDNTMKLINLYDKLKSSRFSNAFQNLQNKFDERRIKTRQFINELKNKHNGKSE